jgi:integrase/recombinase XerD
MTANGIYQMIARRDAQAGDLTELNGWSSPQMLRRYGPSARSARARRAYDRIMANTPRLSLGHGQ